MEVSIISLSTTFHISEPLGYNIKDLFLTIYKSSMRLIEIHENDDTSYYEALTIYQAIPSKYPVKEENTRYKMQN